MSISTQSITSFSNFKRTGAVQGIFALTALAFVAGMSGPAAARPGAYDGTWNVVFTTRAGHCSSNNSAPFNVSGRQVSSAGGGKVTGGIGPGGAVSVHISVGLSAAERQGPPRWQLRNRPLERDLAGYAGLVSIVSFLRKQEPIRRALSSGHEQSHFSTDIGGYGSPRARGR